MILTALIIRSINIYRAPLMSNDLGQIQNTMKRGNCPQEEFVILWTPGIISKVR